MSLSGVSVALGEVAGFILVCVIVYVLVKKAARKDKNKKG